MPDNSADYEDFEDLPPEFDVDDHPARVWNLLLLINPGDEESALRQFDSLREQLGGEVSADDERWLWALKDAIDWQAGFFVDADDIDAFISAIDELAARWNLRIDWGGDLDDEDFVQELDVQALMAVAHDRLREHGYTLWTWNTGNGCHAGWAALRRDDEAMLALCSLLDVEVRPASDPF